MLGLDWDYERVEVDDTGLARFLASLGSEWRGLSLTMPLKRRVAELVPDVDEVARRTRQGNTILLDRGLVAALESAAVRSPVPTTVVGELPVGLALRPELERNAYFIASEAMTNAVKHAAASRVEVRVAVTEGRLRGVLRSDRRAVLMPVVSIFTFTERGLSHLDHFYQDTAAIVCPRTG